MATSTLGTAATSTLTAVPFSASLAPADVATIAQGIKDDLNVSHPIWPGAFALNGKLYIPNRGVLTILPGDYVGFDSATGWPILVSKRAAANAGWVHVP